MPNELTKSQTRTRKEPSLSVDFINILVKEGDRFGIDPVIFFEKMGFEKVEAFIASGNLVFETKSKSMDSIKKNIESELEKSLGYNVPTFIRTTGEIKTILEYKPFKESEINNPQNSLYIGFLDKAPSKENQHKLYSLHMSNTN